MGIAKEIFGMERKDKFYCGDFNQVIDLIDAFEISEEAIVCVIASKHSGNIKEAVEIAKAVKANARKIFVRRGK